MQKSLSYLKSVRSIRSAYQSNFYIDLNPLVFTRIFDVWNDTKTTFVNVRLKTRYTVISCQINDNRSSNFTLVANFEASAA